MKDIHRLAHLGVILINISYGGVKVQIGAKSSLVVEVVQLLKIKVQSTCIMKVQSTCLELRFSPNGEVVRYNGRLYFSKVGNLSKNILTKAYIYIL